MRATRLLLVLFALCGFPLWAHGAVVVTACGTPPQTYSVGQQVPETIDTKGNLCLSAAGSSGVSGTPITGNATGSTGAVVGTLAAAVGKTTYICGFDVSAIGGTAAVGPVTIAGLTGSSMVYQLSSTAAGVTLQKTFTPCIPASAQNTAVTITTTADGTATAVDVNSWGYQQ